MCRASKKTSLTDASHSYIGLVMIPRYPKELARIICEYAVTWQFLPWVEAMVRKNPRLIRHDMMQLWKNQNGIDMALRENLPMSWPHLSANPHPWAVERLLANPKQIAWEKAFGNPGLPYVTYQWHWPHPDDWCKGSYGTSRDFSIHNPRDEYVTDTLKRAPSNPKWISRNPNIRAVEYAIAGNLVNGTTAWSNPNPRMFEHLMTKCAKSAAIRHVLTHNEDPVTGLVDPPLFDDISVDWKYLSANSHPTAIEMLRTSPQHINWSNLLTNPGIFCLRVDTGVFELLSK